MPYLKRDAPCPEPLDCRILTAALALFVENGYHSVSVHEIQKNADASIGSIYKHFGGKEGIAKALYTHLLNELDELISAVTQELQLPSQQCEEIIKQLFEHTETHKHIIAFLFHSKHTEYLSGESLENNAEAFIKIRKIITQGIKQDEFIDIDTWVATSMIFGGAIKMIQLRLDGVITSPLTDYYEVMISSVWKGLKTENNFHIFENI